MIRLAFVFCMALGASASAQTPTPAPDAAPLIHEAGEAYAAGEYGRSRRALEQSLRSVAAKFTDGLAALLPAPLEGWQANEDQSSDVALSMFGGGVTLTRTYSGEAGDVVIEILADSDLVEQLSQMYGDDQAMSAMGIKVETVAGETAIIEPGGGRMLFLLDKRTMVAVSGSASPDIRLSYAEKIGFAGIRALK